MMEMEVNTDIYRAVEVEADPMILKVEGTIGVEIRTSKGSSEKIFSFTFIVVDQCYQALVVLDEKRKLVFQYKGDAKGVARLPGREMQKFEFFAGYIMDLLRNLDAEDEPVGGIAYTIDTGKTHDPERAEDFLEELFED